MDWPKAALQRSVVEQIRVNQARTPTQRMLALCTLLNAVEALLPDDDEARRRRQQILESDQRDREQLLEFLRKHIQAERAAASASALVVERDAR